MEDFSFFSPQKKPNKGAEKLQIYFKLKENVLLFKSTGWAKVFLIEPVTEDMMDGTHKHTLQC